MIRVHTILPEIYFKESRDFQAIARAYEVLYNYLKTNVDITEALPFSDNFDSRLLDLMALTIGFVSKHNYNTKDLFNLCSSFADILKSKGSIVSINKTLDMLLNAQHIKSATFIDTSSDDSHNLLIYVPVELEDLVLLEDIFDYILPSGYTYSFIKSSFLDKIEAVKLTSTDAIYTQSYGAESMGQVAKYNTNTVPFTDTTHPTSIATVGSPIYSVPSAEESLEEEEE